MGSLSVSFQFTARRNVGGFSLVELMVSLTLSLLLMAGVITMFTSSRATFDATAKLSEVEENGRFALELIARDLRSAGYKDCNLTANIKNRLTNFNTMMYDFANPVGGYEYTTAAAWTASGVTTDAPSIVADNDALIVKVPMTGSTRRLTVSMGVDTDNPTIKTYPSGNPGAFTPGQILMIGNCNEVSYFQATTYTATTGIITHTATGLNVDASLGAAYGVDVPIRAVRTSIFYLRNTASGTGGGTSLWRRTNGATTEELVEGIERFQLQYGVDDDGNRTVDRYTTADQLPLASDWAKVISVNVALVARSLEANASTVDTNVYQLFDYPSTTWDPTDDRRIRKMFTTTVSIRNGAL